MNVGIASGAVLMVAAALLVALLPAEGPPTNHIDTGAGPLPNNALARIGSPRLRHAGEIAQIVYSPDGKWLASVSTDPIDSTAQLWDAATGRERLRVRVAIRDKPISNRFEPISLGFSADGKSLLILDRNAFRSFDVVSGRELVKHITNDGAPFPIRGTDQPLANAAISPDGTAFVRTWTNGQFDIHDATTGRARARESHPFLNMWPVPIEFSGDSRRFVLGVASKASAEIFDAQSGDRIAEVEVEDQRLDQLRFMPGDRELVGKLSSAERNANTAMIALINAQNGKLVRTIPIPPATTAFAVSPDGKFVVTGNNSKLHSELVEIETGRVIGQLPSMPTIRQLTFSADGKLLAGTHSSSGTITVWDMASRGLHSTSPDPQHYFRTTFSTDGRLLVLDQPGRPMVDWHTGQIVRRFANVEDAEYPFFTFTSLSPDQKLYAVPDRNGPIRIVDAETGQTLRTFIGHTVSPRAKFSRDCQRLVSYSFDNPIRIWDTASGKEIAQIKTPEKAVTDVVLSANGRVLASATRQPNASGTTVSTWDADTGKQLARMEADNVFFGGLALSSDGRTVVGGGGRSGSRRQTDTNVTVWDASTGRVLHSLGGHTSDAVRPSAFCAFSPDGRLLATGDSAGHLRLWEVLSGQEVYQFHGHHSQVMPNFSPDGRLIVAASQDAPCFVWDVIGASRPGESGDPAEVWRDLSDADAKVAFLAFRKLVAHPQFGLDVVQNQLKESIRIESAETERLIRDLDAPTFRVRERASAELLRIAERIEPRLIQARAKGSPEVRSRIDSILGRMTRPSPERLLISRAFGVLECIAQPESAQILDTFAAGQPDDPVTIEATESRDRLANRGVK